MRTPPLTDHACERMSRRRISEQEIEVTIQYGRELFRAGARFCFMGRKEVQRVPLSLREGLRLEGVTVVADGASNTIITTYRNKTALHAIKRKPKHGGGAPCPERGRYRSHHGAQDHSYSA